MSTKTTFKRVALVTVAALGLGVLSVAPSSAAVQLDTFALSSATGTTTVGTAVTVNATVAFLQESSSDSMTVTLSYIQAPSGITVGEVAINAPFTADASDAGSPTVDTSTARVAKVSAAAAASLKKTLVITLTPTKAGTYVIRATPAIVGGGTPASTFKDWTVTVAAKTVKSSSVFMGVGVTSPVTDTHTADATVAVTAAASTTPKARIDVASIYGLTANDTVTAADAPAVVVTTDKGLVSKTQDYSAGAKSVTTLAAVDGDPSYWVYSNGDIGAATITITVGTAAAVTKTVTFKGAATALVAATTLTAATPLWVTLGTAKTTVVTAKDAGATAVTVPTGLTVKSSDTAVATVAIHATDGTVTVTPVAAGNATVTVTDPATSAAATAVTFPITVAVVKSKVAPAITFDKTSYNVGELVTMTISSVMGDSATANLFTAALVSSAAVVASGTAHTGTTHAVAGGKVTYKFYAPAVAGAWTITGTTGADVDLATAATVTAGFDIVNPGVDAATAAAEAAEAAAQDATDAALDATTAAEAAGALAQEAVDAVAELAANVTKLFTELNAQIAKLTTLILKVGTSVAKIAAKK